MKDKVTLLKDIIKLMKGKRILKKDKITLKIQKKCKLMQNIRVVVYDKTMSHRRIQIHELK